MTALRNAWLTGWKYRGGGSMLSWVLHRLGGLAMLIFVGMHVLASFLTQQFGSDLGTNLNIIYQAPAFQIVLMFFVLFHALNGVRIIILDTLPKFLDYQRELTWLQWFIFIPLYLMVVYFIASGVLTGS